MRYADLHVHTFYSDSTFSPEEVVKRAIEVGLGGIAICDHDSVDGIEPCRIAASAAAAAGGAPELEIIPGIEITVEKADAEIHILGFFIDWHAPWLRERLKEIERLRLERVHTMVGRLREAGIPLTVEDVISRAGKGTIGRLHVAQAMVRTGAVGTLAECFDKYIGFMKPCYVSSVRFSAEESVGMIRRAGGVPVIAHPHVSGADNYIPELVDYGLCGIEAYHTEHKAHVSKRYEALAKRHDLIVTGGSDCHGLAKGKILMGGVRVPYTVVEKLRETAAEVRRGAR